MGHGYYPTGRGYFVTFSPSILMVKLCSLAKRIKKQAG
jgi:hypothetical protein